MTFSIGIVILLAIIAGVLAILALLGKPNGLVLVSVGVLLEAIALLVEHAPH